MRLKWVVNFKGVEQICLANPLVFIQVQNIEEHFFTKVQIDGYELLDAVLELI